ncbi:MAG: oxygen-independent coproporphyrinogen III oxidase [Blastocatellia bacterium]
MTDLFSKYDVPAPRYTSYPTVPFWSEPPTTERWLRALNEGLSEEAVTWSLYLHLPFCETLCTYCACNTVITRDHGREADYVELLSREWALYRAAAPALGQRPLRQLHLGGGTPTFFSPENLRRILTPMLDSTRRDEANFDASVEVDPRHTSREHLAALRDLGFSRVSLGVQDFDPEVQRIVNRVQPFEQTARVTGESRELGYDSVNFDLIYGLPKQTRASIELTARRTIELRPDRIALYSFALVPWIKPTQRSYRDEDLPRAGEKRALYELARELLLGAGYLEIGMDHFAMPRDSLARAQAEGRLHRNFMGYTEARTRVLLGLGVSAISETPTCFHQNEKAFPVYERQLRQGALPTLRGHLLDEEDRRLREQILVFMTRFEVALTPEQRADAPVFLESLLADGLVTLERDRLRLTERGLPFLRNACMFFDQRLRRRRPEARTFSQAM